MMDELLKSSRVIVCAGSGGVGKTTVAASLALRACEIGRKTLVLTVDPARRLASTLGLSSSATQDTPVQTEGMKGQLSAAILDSREIFDDFVRRTASSTDLAERLIKNRLYHQLSTTLNGSQEFTAFERLYSSVQAARYDLIVLDTPPTQHALDFLRAPERIERLFQDSITRWFAKPAEEAGWLRQILNQGTRQALRGLEILTGKDFISSLTDFFASINSFQSTLRDHSQEIRKLLHDPSTQFVLVTSFDVAKLREAEFFVRQLESEGHHLAAVIINRAFPDGLALEPQTQEAADPIQQKLLVYYQAMSRYYADRIRLYAEFQKHFSGKVKVLKIPEFHYDIGELAGLAQIYQSLREA